MHNGMSLPEMLSEVVRQSETKRDFVADTKETIRMVRMPDFPDGVAMVLATHTAPAVGMDTVPYLERFTITDNCHSQIASRLQIPMKYYRRLLKDHTDLVIENVNTLFEREPQIRMVRTLDGKARAFLSDQYNRIDNDEVLQATLPVIRNDYDTTMLNTHVDENQLRLRCLFNGDSHAIDVGKTHNGQSDIIHTGFEMGNHETGGGSLYIRGFLWRSYCTNGCVFGVESTDQMRFVHVGKKIGIPDGFQLSDDTKRKHDDLIISASRDMLKHLSSPAFAEKVGERIRALRDTQHTVNPHASVETVCKELGLTESDAKHALESFIQDRDYSQWGMVNAVTSVAKRVESFEHAAELEEAGNKIINLPVNRWRTIATIEKVAA